MQVTNRSNCPQVWAGVILQPGDRLVDGEVIPRDPLDHDFDGRKGGSLPKSKRGRPKKGIAK